MERLQRVFGASGMGHLPSDSRFPRSPRDANHGGPACPWRSCASCSASLSTTTPSRSASASHPPFSLEDNQSQFQLTKTGITTQDFCTPNARLYGRRPNKLLTARGDSGVIEQSISYLGFWSIC
ncbi:unnamed protein product [Urochloa humidicola]